jgi:hypothetical protein
VLLSKQEQIFELFNSLLAAPGAFEETLRSHALEAVRSWSDVHLKLQILLDEKLITNIILLSASDIFFTPCCEILANGVTNSNYADVLL